MARKNPLSNYRNSQTPRLTQADLARDLKVARTTIARWETGARKPDESLLAKITEKTGIPAKELRPDLIEKHEEIFGGAA